MRAEGWKWWKSSEHGASSQRSMTSSHASCCTRATVPAQSNCSNSSWAISRETGVTFFGPFVLGAMALARSEPGARREALREGQAILDRGCVSHNYFWFYRDAIEVSLADADWDAAEAYALALESYFRAEAAPWPAFIGARGHALAEFGGRGPSESVVAQVRRLRDEAAHLGMSAERSALEAALESDRCT